MPIRSATPDDASKILAIYTPFVNETAITFESQPPTEPEFSERIALGLAIGPWLVAEEDNQILGYAYATKFRERAAYDSTRETTVYVRPGHHGAGIGRQLMSDLLAELRASGVSLAVAGITLPNDASVGLHEHLGFTAVGVFHGVGQKLGTSHDVGFWELALT